MAAPPVKKRRVSPSEKLAEPFWHGVRGRSGRSLFKTHVACGIRVSTHFCKCVTFGLEQNTPPFGEACVCVCHPWSHRDAFAFVLLQGGSARLTDTTPRRHCQLVVKQCGTPHCVPAYFPTFWMA